jgi:hypothetical protein
VDFILKGGELMMSLADIRYFQRKAATAASRQRKRPLLVDSGDLADWKAEIALGRIPSTLHIPNFGDYTPAGYTRGDSFFVAKAGIDGDGGPALSIRSLVNHMKPGYGYAMTEEGPFQCYVTEFIPKGAVRKGTVRA